MPRFYINFRDSERLTEDDVGRELPGLGGGQSRRIGFGSGDFGG
jgi:hypothetical protein